MIKSKLFQFRTMCTGSQLQKVHYRAVFDQLNLGLKRELLPAISNEDIKTGFMVFSAMVYCLPPMFTIYNFLQRLLTSETPRTIMQATVNTIEIDIIKEQDNKLRFNKFYTILDKVFNFQLDKIILATASSSQLDKMLAKDLPYFTKYFEEIDQCITGKTCQGVSELLQSLGKLNIYLLTKL